MEFDRYMMIQKYLKPEEVLELRESQLQQSLAGQPRDSEGFLDAEVGELESLESVREIPIGDVLKTCDRFMGLVTHRSGKGLDELIDDWREYHRVRMEPIAIYSTDAKYGSALYTNQIEKQLVGMQLTKPSSIVKNGDKVVLTEGSSAFYVGMAMAAQKTKATIISSNGPLIREFRDNPAIARSIQSFRVIGGEIDYDIEHQRSENGGVYGDECLQQYRRAIKKKPGATVVCMAVTGLLPDQGPFAGDDKSSGVKREIILAAIEAGVRRIVILTDYSKVLPGREAEYGAPLFAEDHWERLLHENEGRIAIATCPPPALRKSIRDMKDPDVRRRDPRNMPNKDEFDNACWEYSMVAPKLDLIARSNNHPGLYEACEAVQSNC